MLVKSVFTETEGLYIFFNTGFLIAKFTEKNLPFFLLHLCYNSVFLRNYLHRAQRRFSESVATATNLYVKVKISG